MPEPPIGFIRSFTRCPHREPSEDGSCHGLGISGVTPPYLVHEPCVSRACKSCSSEPSSQGGISPRRCHAVTTCALTIEEPPLRPKPPRRLCSDEVHERLLVTRMSHRPWCGLVSFRVGWQRWTIRSRGLKADSRRSKTESSRAAPLRLPRRASRRVMVDGFSFDHHLPDRGQVHDRRGEVSPPREGDVVSSDSLVVDRSPPSTVRRDRLLMGTPALMSHILVPRAEAHGLSTCSVRSCPHRLLHHSCASFVAETTSDSRELSAAVRRSIPPRERCSPVPSGPEDR